MTDFEPHSQNFSEVRLQEEIGLSPYFCPFFGLSRFMEAIALLEVFSARLSSLLTISI